MKSRIAVPLSRPAGLISTHALARLQRGSPRRRSDASCARMSRCTCGELRRARDSAARATRPCPRAAGPRGARRTAASCGAAARASRHSDAVRAAYLRARRAARSRAGRRRGSTRSPEQAVGVARSLRPVIERDRAAELRRAAPAAALRARGIDAHAVGRRRDVEQRAVDVEEQRPRRRAAAADRARTARLARRSTRRAHVVRRRVVAHAAVSRSTARDGRQPAALAHHAASISMRPAQR